MYPYLNYILAGYVLLYFIVLMILPTLIVGRKIGINPIVLSATDDAHGLIAQYFMICMVAVGVYVLLYAVYPACHGYFLPVTYLQGDILTGCGLAVLAFSLIWTSISQANMQSSWRVGIDKKHKTTLVTTGIFRFSRNPIYLGMIASFIGLFLVTPDTFTLIIVVIGNVLVQIQVRLEEDFLYKEHGQDYLAYRRNTRRFI